MRSLQWYKRGAAYSLAVYRLRGDCKSAGTPDGRQTPDESVRNPWSKNALLTQRNPMKKYPGEEWVKSGEEWCATLHLSEPLCLSGFQAIW